MTDIDRIVSFVDMFLEEGQVTELRAFNNHSVFIGTYDKANLRAMATAAIELERNCKGVYFLPNPINRQATNNIGQARSGTEDSDIIRRNWLLIDVDPVRPSDTSATDSEREEAWKVLANVKVNMEAAGFRHPVVASSGNGWHICYRIDMPNDESSRDAVRSLLHGLDARFSTNKAKVDKKTFNASRIWKLYGTKARKGESTDERPHRLAWVQDSIATKDLEHVKVRNTEAVQNLLKAWQVQDNTFKTIEIQHKSSEAARRASSYLSKIPPAISGQGGHDRTYHAACILVEGFGLTPDDALPLMQEWNATCQPPWTVKELERKLRDADKNAGPSRGILLGSSIKPSRADKRAYNGPDEDQYDPELDPDATACDLITVQSKLCWAWPNWIQRSAITAIASDPGVGKTRLCADLLRRVYHGLPWPDGSAPSFPVGSKVLWVASDSQWAELASLPAEFGFAPEALYLNGKRSNPYAGTNLDAIEDLSEFEKRIKRIQPALVFVDTCGNATDRNTTRPEEAKGFFKPLAEIAVRTNTAIVLVTHLSKGGEALGRRIVGACRQVIKMDHPDKSQANRRRLWVDKTNSKKPDPLGVTMGDTGNEYDNSPPESVGGDEPGRTTKSKPTANQAHVDWLKNELSIGPSPIRDIIVKAESVGMTADHIFKAQRACQQIEQYTDDNNKKWWKLNNGGQS